MYNFYVLYAHISAPRIFLPLKTTKEHVSLDFPAHSRTGKLGGKVSSKVFLNELKWFKFMVGLICVHTIGPQYLTYTLFDFSTFTLLPGYPPLMYRHDWPGPLLHLILRSRLFTNVQKCPFLNIKGLQHFP